MRKITQYVDDQTGEVGFHKEESMPPSRYKEGKGYMLLSNDKRIHLPFKVALIETGLKEHEIRYVIMLAAYLDENNSLHHRGRSMTTQEISEIISLSLNNVYALIRRLIALDVATRYEGVYYLNPLVITINRYITPLCYRAWDAYLADHLSAWAVDRLEKQAPAVPKLKSIGHDPKPT